MKTYIRIIGVDYLEGSKGYFKALAQKKHFDDLLASELS